MTRLLAMLFSCPHPAVPFMVWGPAAGLLLHSGWDSQALLSCLGWILAGGFAWTLLEYLLHRLLFHWRPNNTTLRHVVSHLHLQHHADPRDPTKIFTPPLSALFVFLIFFAVCNQLLPIAAVPVFLGGLLLGYMAYEYLHYAIHHATLPTVWGRGCQRRHLAHHHHCPDANFGVTNDFWDGLLRSRHDGRVHDT